MSGRIQTLCVALLAIVICQVSLADDAVRRSKSHSRPLTKPKFDPDAKKVALFDGIEDGSFETKVIASGPYQGNVLISNTTDQPLTVELPESFVAVHVLKQFQTGNQLFNNGPGNGNLLGGGNAQQGGQQTIGGGFPQQNNGANNGFNQPGGNLFGFGNPGGMMGNGNGLGNGNGFFSIPPEKTLKVKFLSACMSHGKPDPTPSATYQLVKTDSYTADPVLQQLLRLVGTGQQPQKVAQAAIWNRTDHMSWQQLAAKTVYSIGRKVPYFSRQQLSQAETLIRTATELAAKSARQNHTNIAANQNR